MPSLRTRALAAGACFFAGILAGVTANRSLVELPTWQKIGVIPWAAFNRAEADGLTALFYPALGLLAIVLTIVTAIMLRLDRSAPRSARLPAYLAALLAILYAAITRGILVPALSHLRTTGDDLIEFQRTFATTARWSGVNDLLHIVAFGLSLWVFARIASRPART